jgi:hypothetical protein
MTVLRSQARRGWMTGRGFQINKLGIERFARELQKEFDKHPNRIDVKTELPELPDITHGATAVYNGPVIIGSANGTQLAWGNSNVNQSRVEQPQQIAESFEAIARVVTEILRQLPSAGLDGEEEALATEAADEILALITQSDPAPNKVKRALAILRGVLAPLAIGVQSGAKQAATEWAKASVEHLTKLIS